MTTLLPEEKIAELVRARAHFRSTPTLEIRDVADNGRYIEGRAVPYNRWADIGWFRERFMPGAFTKSIREAARCLPLLLWHDSRSFPIGVSHEWRDNDDGLDCVWKIDTDHPLAADTLRQSSDGLLVGLSIGFAPVERIGKGADGTPVDLNNELEIDELGVISVTRREARLLEVSLTPTPAYVGARVTGVRHKAGRSAEVDGWREYLNSIT